MIRLTNQRGDTLVEVVFALIILSAILVTTLSIGRLSRVNNQNAQLRTQAVNLVQEQYQALKSYRDSTNWQLFQGYPGSSGLNIDVMGGCNSNALADPATDPKCVFHMERDFRIGATHGQWLPCPGTWNPPLDSDNDATTPGSGWDSPTTAAESSTIVQGCRGNTRTQTNQPNISVGIYLHTGLSCSLTQPNAYRFTAVGNWTQGGVSSNATTNMDFMLSNIKGEATC
ncbi:MAG TPA: type II secretion system protein [Candidatus Saccharimonadales bacterium]|nr:type II secretion system protein [Candidatus Saccharimonadales bacterium]